MRKLFPLVMMLSLPFLAAQPDTMPAGSVQNSGGVARENIEWLDIWLPNSNDHKLPRVLIVGDSITRAYNKPVEALLKGKAYVSRLATSKCLGDPLYLPQVEGVLQEQQFEVIHFNNGMHGEGYSEEQYAADFPKLIALLRKYDPKAKLICATTTDVRVKGELDKRDAKTERMIARNKIAAEICGREGIAVDDLFGLCVDKPELHAGDGVHFNAKGVELQAGQVAKVVGEALGK